MGVKMALLIEMGKQFCPYVWAGVKTWWHQRHFRAFFGEDIRYPTNFHLVDTYFELDTSQLAHCNSYPHVYRKVGRSNVLVSIETPVSRAELRATKYLTEAIVAGIGEMPSLRTDYELKEPLNISFVSFGGSNYKSEDALRNAGNQFVHCEKWEDTCDKDGRKVLEERPSEMFDYGLILKIHPTQRPHRTWFVCAGIGEWGTSGAANYLAHRWRKIYEDAKRKEFAIIVRVEKTKDESAERIRWKHGDGPWNYGDE